MGREKLSCEAARLCQQYLESLNLPQDLFEQKHDRCYCHSCAARDKLPDVIRVAGERYELPIGFTGFGLKVPPRATMVNIWDSWHVSFHGCAGSVLPSILAEGGLLLPGDTLLNGIKLGAIHTRGGEQRHNLYTTPSVRYASLEVYVGKERFRGLQLSVVLQCRQQPGYRVGPETVNWEKKNPGKDISLHFKNSEIERSTRSRGSIIPYRLLVKLEKPRKRAAEQDPLPGALGKKRKTKEAKIRVVALSRSGSSVVVHDRNGHDAHHVPPEAVDALCKRHTEKVKIRSVALTQQGGCASACTKAGGWAVISGDNEYDYHGIPEGAGTAIQRRRAEGVRIRLVSFAPNGGWVVIHGLNGHDTYDIPTAALDAIKKRHSEHAKIRSVAFTSRGGWAVISGKHDYDYDGIPEGAGFAIQRRHAEGVKIRLVAFAPNGGWVVIHGLNGYDYADIPPEAEGAIRKLNGCDAG